MSGTASYTIFINTLRDVTISSNDVASAIAATAAAAAAAAAAAVTDEPDIAPASFGTVFSVEVPSSDGADTPIALFGNTPQSATSAPTAATPAAANTGAGAQAGDQNAETAAAFDSAGRYVRVASFAMRIGG